MPFLGERHQNIFMVSWTCRRALLNWPTLRSGGVFRLRGATAISQQARAAEGLLGNMSSRSILEGGCRGKILPRCVPGLPAMAISRRDAFPGGDPWQLFRFMRSRGGLGWEKRQFVATYRRRASKMIWLRQDMRAMHPKSPANGRSGMHRARILPRRGPFRCARPSNHAQRTNLAIPRCSFERFDLSRAGGAVLAVCARPPACVSPPAHCVFLCGEWMGCRAAPRVLFASFVCEELCPIAKRPARALSALLGLPASSPTCSFFSPASLSSRPRRDRNGGIVSFTAENMAL